MLLLKSLVLQENPLIKLVFSQEIMKSFLEIVGVLIISVILLMKITESSRKGKKWVAEFQDGTKTHFGATGYTDFTLGATEDQRKRYIARHQKEDHTDPKKAGTLSRFILWEHRSKDKAIREYKKKFAI
jgi:hypothetical protein